MRALIAEDNLEYRTLFLHEVSCVFGPLSAVEVCDASMFEAALAEGGFDLAVTGSRPGWSDALEIARRLRAQCPGLPVILFTDSIEMAAGALRAGFDDCVLKSPSCRNDIRSAVQFVLNKAGQRAAEQEQRLRLTAVLNTVADAIITIDETGTIDSFNPAAERIFGYAAGEVIGCNVSMLMPSPFAEEHDRYLAGYLRTGIGRIIGIGRELLGKRKSGEVFALELAITDTPLPTRRLFTGVCRDIAERKRTESALADARGQALLAERAKSDFLANMSHELRTPLNAIMGFTEALLLELFGPVENQRQRGYLRDIRAGAARLFETVTRTLDFIEANKGSRVLVETQIELGALIRQASARHRVAANARGQQLTLDIAADLPPICADELAVRQIVENLLDNAIKFTNAVGTIALAARLRSDDGVEICVRDNGIGVSPADHAAVTSPFALLASPYARRTQGVGLGLPLSKTLIELHGGTLTFDSVPGAGTTVTVMFPPSRVGATRAASAARTECGRRNGL